MPQLGSHAGDEERATQRDLPAAQTDDVQPVQPLTASHLLEVVEFVEPSSFSIIDERSVTLSMSVVQFSFPMNT